MSNFTKFYLAVKSNFCFLEKDLNFRCMKAKSNFYRYESENVFFEIYYDDGFSYELDFSFGLKPKELNGEELKYYGSELMRLIDPSHKFASRAIQISDENDVEGFVRMLAEFLKKYGAEFLRGNKKVYERIEKFRKEDSKRYSEEVKMKRIRKDADRAWKNKNFIAIVQLLSPVRALLTHSEKKKLDFASKKQKICSSD